MFEGDFADTRAGKIPLVPMWGWAEGPACVDTGARNPIGASGILSFAKEDTKSLQYIIAYAKENMKFLSFAKEDTKSS